MIKTSHHEEEVTRGSCVMASIAGRPGVFGSPALFWRRLDVPRLDGSVPLWGWDMDCTAPAVVLASGPLLHDATASFH